MIALDVWWSGTPGSFELWWIPLIAANGACLALILWPLIRDKW